MRNIRVVFVFILVFCFLISLPSAAVIRTVYQSNDLIEIRTRKGEQTILVFETDIKFFSNLDTYFSIQYNEELFDRLIINPVEKGVKKDLVVETADGNFYVFSLVEQEKREEDTLIQVKPKEKVPRNILINLITQKRLHVDYGDLKDHISFYDVIEGYFVQNDLVKIELLRSAIVENIDETVYWLRINNISPEMITINKIGLKGRKTVSVGVESGREKVAPDGFSDFFLFTEGQGNDQDMTLNIAVLNNEFELTMTDIPYVQKNITIYDFN